MMQIKTLVKMIKQELDDAQKYAEMALQSRDKDQKLSEMYLTLAKEELHHKDMEHDQVVRLIKQYEAQGHTVPQTMRVLWDWQHQQIIQRQSYVRTMISMYKT